MARILVVDDHEETRYLLQRVLSHFGHEVACASEGKGALEALSANIPDLMILDLSMPGVSGADVLCEIRANPRTASLPVIIFSAYPDSIYKEIARKAGATAYWIKGSIELAEMEAAIEHILAAVEPSAPADTPAPRPT